MSAHASTNAELFAGLVPAARERPDERTRVATAIAYLLAFGVAVPVAILVGLLTLLDPPQPPADTAARGGQTVVHSPTAAGVAGNKELP